MLVLPIYISIMEYARTPYIYIYIYIYLLCRMLGLPIYIYIYYGVC